MSQFAQEALILFALCFLGNTLFVIMGEVEDRRPLQFWPMLGAIAALTCMPVVGMMTASMGFVFPIMLPLCRYLEERRAGL